MAIGTNTKATINTQDTELLPHQGETVTVLHPLEENLFDREEVGPMWVAQLSDGTTRQFFEDELIEQ